MQFKNKCKSFIKNVDIQNDIQENSKKFVEKSNTLYKKLNHNKENAPINPWVQFKENMNESFQRNPNMQPKKRYSYKHRRLAPRYVVKV